MMISLDEILGFFRKSQILYVLRTTAVSVAFNGEYAEKHASAKDSEIKWLKFQDKPKPTSVRKRPILSQSTILANNCFFKTQFCVSGGTFSLPTFKKLRFFEFFLLRAANIRQGCQNCILSNQMNKFKGNNFSVKIFGGVVNNSFCISGGTF